MANGHLYRTVQRILEREDPIPDDISLPLIMASNIEIYELAKEGKKKSDSNEKKLIGLGIFVAVVAILIGAHTGVPLLLALP